MKHVLVFKLSLKRKLYINVFIFETVLYYLWNIYIIIIFEIYIKLLYYYLWSCYIKPLVYLSLRQLYIYYFTKTSMLLSLKVFIIYTKKILSLKVFIILQRKEYIIFEVLYNKEKVNYYHKENYVNWFKEKDLIQLQRQDICYYHKEKDYY